MSEKQAVVVSLTTLLMLEPAKPAMIWTEQDYAGLLAHQLKAPLPDDLTTLPEVDNDQVHSLTAEQGHALNTFEDLLTCPQPPLGLLVLAKSFAKKLPDMEGAGLPKPVALVFYQAMIAAAFVRHGEMISTHSPRALVKAFDKSLGRPWLPETIRDVIGQAYLLLNSDTNT